MNTMVAGSAGALTVYLMNSFIKISSYDRWNLVMLCDGNLAGLVSVTGSCNNIEPWAAFVIGILGGFTYLMVTKALHVLKVDDPVDAVPIHLVIFSFHSRVVAFWELM